MAKSPRNAPRSSAPLSGVAPVAPKRARHSKTGSVASEIPVPTPAEISPLPDAEPAPVAEADAQLPPQSEAAAISQEIPTFGGPPSVGSISTSISTSASAASGPGVTLEPSGVAPGPPLATAGPVPLVLIAHSDPALLRLVRESMEAFLHCEVRTTSSALTAFDRVLQEPYRLLLLDLHLPGLGGEMLYDLISRAYPRVHALSYVAPPVIWLGVHSDYPRQDELTREARTKALLTLPLNIQRLLSTAATSLGRKS